jgi:Gpi18-like mannosyltransferase
VNKFILIFSALYLTGCALLLVPQIQSLMIAFAEEHIVSVQGKVEHPEGIIRYAVLGFMFYVFLLFLYILEKLVIKREESRQYNWEMLFIIIITALSAAIRLAGFNHKTGDYFTQSEWVSHFRENGHFLGYKNFLGNYNAIYMYLLSILSYLPESIELYVMKTFSCVFDYICAIFSMKIIRQITENRKTGLLAYAIVLFSPTVFMNSGLWAQCDSMHTAFVLISLYYLLNNRIRISMICFGIGLSFKLQAVFPLPFIICLFVYKKISMKNLLYICIGFFGVSIPAWLLGWQLTACIMNYITGTNISSEILTLNAPTIFTWGNIPGIMPVIFITAVLFCIGFLIINKHGTPSNNTLLLLFLFCNFAVPFFLPNMHERYFYIGEIAVLLYSIVNPKRFWISIAVIMPALATYAGYLWGRNPFSLIFLSGVMFFAIIFIFKWLIESIFLDTSNVSSKPAVVQDDVHKTRQEQLH